MLKRISGDEHTRQNKKGFTTTILAKQNICIQSVPNHAYLRLKDAKSESNQLEKVSTIIDNQNTQLSAFLLAFSNEVWQNVLFNQKTYQDNWL